MKRTGFYKNSKTGKIIGCSFVFFKKHIEAQFEDGMTWENHGKWHIDHIIPISYARTQEDVIRLNHYTNLQPLWARENILKSDRLPPVSIREKIYQDYMNATKNNKR